MKLYVRDRDWRQFRWVIIAVTLVALLASIKQSINDTRKYQGFDFGWGVVAGRALNAGFDPYRTRLKTDESGWPVKPATPLQAYNRLLFAPTMLCVHAALAPLPYLTQRFIWLAGSWVSFLATLGMLVQLQRSSRHRILLILFAVWFFAVSDFWRRHLLQGKYYSMLMLLLTAGSWLVVRGKKNGWASGVMFGIAAALRPTIAIAALPLWIAGRRYAAVVTVGIMLVLSAATLLVVKPSTWVDSVKAVKIAERETQHGYEKSPPEFVLEPETHELRVDATFTQSNQQETKAVPFQNVVLDVMILKPMYAHFGAPDRSHWHEIELVTGGTVLAGFFGAFLLSEPAHLSRRTLSLLIIVSVLAIDFFLPERWSYNDVQYLLPLGLALPLIGRKSVPLWIPMLLATGLTLGHDRLIETNGKWMAMARLLGLLGGPALLAVWLCLRRYNQKRQIRLATN